MPTIASPLPQFFDLAGDPLTGGKLYFGQPNQNPITAPIDVFWDAAYTQPAAQPVPTLNGYAVRAGTPALLFAANDTSMLVVDAQGRQVLYAKTSIEASAADALRADLASTATGKGAELVGVPGSADTAGEKLQRFMLVSDFPGVTAGGVVDSTAGVAAAVAAAKLAGVDLWWPGVYLTTASIPDLHNVRHFGPGGVKRGSATFYIDPKQGQSNTLNIAASGGSSTNDGLGTSEAMNSFQTAFTALANYGPVLNGTWTVQAAAGTYTISAGSQNHYTPSRNRVIVKGPAAGHPNVPTAIIDGGGVLANYLHGLNFDGPGVYVQVQDIKAINFKSAGNTRIGFLFANGCDGYAVNLHSLDCSWAGAYFKECTGRLAGGILDANSTGAYGFIADTAKMSFGYGSTSDATGPQTKNAISAGVYWSTGSQGHIDYHQSTGNGVAVLIAENSRADVIGGAYDVAAGKFGIRAITGGMWGSGGVAPTFTGAGTYIEAKAYSGNIDELDDQGSGSWQRIAFDRTNRSASGVTSGTFPVVYSLAANRLSGVGKGCKVEVFGVYTATAGTALTVNFGGMAFSLTVPTAATALMFTLTAELQEVAGGYRAFGTLSHGLSVPRTGTATAGFVVGSAQDISVGYSLTGAGDSLNIYRTNVYLIG